MNTQSEADIEVALAHLFLARQFFQAAGVRTLGIVDAARQAVKDAKRRAKARKQRKQRRFPAIPADLVPVGQDGSKRLKTRNSAIVRNSGPSTEATPS